MKDLDTDKRIILKRILNKSFAKMWTGLLAQDKESGLAPVNTSMKFQIP